MKKRLPTILITALVTVLICSLFSHFSGPKGIADLSAEDSAFLEKFHTLKEYIDQYAIYDFDEKFAKDAAHLYYMTGIKDDAYAYYFTKEELQDYNTETQGSFVGIGINVMTQTTVLENGLYIYRVVGGSPAEAAGLMTGDVIVEADGVSFINYPYEDAVDVLLDEEGTTAELVVERNGERKSFSVTRKTFEQRNVEYNIYDNLGYIRIYQFAENADEQFQQALNTLLSKNVDGIIFDVRNNPGGELNTVCSMIDMLIPGGEEIIVIEYKDEEEIIYSTNTRLADMPFVVLMNNSSASGSELFSSSLRDILGTKLIGENSFGKGVGQTTFPLNDGSGVKITTFKYLTKSRVDYNNTGLKPDYEVDLDSKWDLEFYTMTFEDDIQLQKAISVLTQEIG
ncbi:MAG: PDZ domain-containing protein [Clostridia bacterium]|nr:PDZ domain-containing protein [Clostridia bacterium]